MRPLFLVRKIFRLFSNINLIDISQVISSMIMLLLETHNLRIITFFAKEKNSPLFRGLFVSLGLFVFLSVIISNNV